MPISESQRAWRVSPAGKAARLAQDQRRRLATQRTCPDCGAPLEKYKHFCDACRRRRKRPGPRRVPQSSRSLQLKNTYGLAETHWEQMLAEQGGLCAICLKPFPEDPDVPRHHRPQVDHDHRCCPGNNVTCGGGCIRGIVHGRCNRGVGQLGDDPLVYLRAAAYIEAANMRLGFAPRDLPLEIRRRRGPEHPALFEVFDAAN